MVVFRDLSFACCRVGGKCMTSDVDWRVLNTVCIMRLKCEKYFTIKGVAVLGLQVKREESVINIKGFV
jgi:hypothetical protein